MAQPDIQCDLATSTEKGLIKKTKELFALQIISLVSIWYKFLLKGISEHRYMFQKVYLCGMM